MKSSQFRYQSPREIAGAKPQRGRRMDPSPFGRLKSGASLEVGAWCFVLFLATSAFAQSYSIDWFTIDGGGATSTGGVYQLSGTIGQPDAGAMMSGGNYSLDGGFWSLIDAVQTPGAPTLTIIPAAPGQATVSWTPATHGFVLQESQSLTSPNWTVAPSGASSPITVSATAPAKFYRLFKP